MIALLFQTEEQNKFKNAPCCDGAPIGEGFFGGGVRRGKKC